MQNKWQKFKAVSNTELKVKEDLFTAHASSDDMTGDWKRQSGSEGFTINGVELKEFSSMFNGFAEAKDVKNFFSQIILKNFQGSKEKIVAYLMQTFNQGGWMYPLSTVLAGGLKDSEGMPVIDARSQEDGRKININLTETGFIVQEMYEVNELALVQKISGRQEPVLIKGSALIKAHATVSLDFRNFESEEKPSVTVEASDFQFSNKGGIRDLLESRLGLQGLSLGQKIVHWIKEAFGLNPTIKSTAPEKPDETLLSPNKEQHVTQDHVLDKTSSYH